MGILCPEPKKAEFIVSNLHRYLFNRDIEEEQYISAKDFRQIHTTLVIGEFLEVCETPFKIMV